MHSSRGILGPFLLLFVGVGACSGSGGSGTDLTAGGQSQTNGGAAASAGGSTGLPSGGTLGSAGSVAASGAGGGTLAGGSGGGSDSTGGSAQTQAGSSSGGAGGSVSTGGTLSGGGGTGAAGSNAGGSSPIGGAGGKPDQSTLPAITVHLAGDSTMSVYAATTTQEGWGQELGQFFIAKVTVDDQAQPGANIQLFYGGSRWKTLIGNVKAGDYVLAAFGINDSGTTHGPVSPPDFQTQMGVMADEVAAKKATFIPTTSSPLQVWAGGKETNARLQPYCDATIALGKAKGLLVDDLNARGVDYYNMIGMMAAAALTFNGDKAHFDKAGATAMAMLAAKDLARINSPLAAYLK